jgi:hypothetical protein
MFPGLKEFMGMQFPYMHYSEKTENPLVDQRTGKRFERKDQQQDIERVDMQRTRGGTGVMRAGGITESLRSSSSRGRGHLHSRLGPNL